MRKKYDSAKEAIEAKETEKEYTYKYALIYLMSEVYLGENNRSDLPFDEILEARFFDESGELHIYNEEDCWYRSEIRDDGEENTEIYKEIYPVSGEIFHEQEENGPIRLEVWKYLNYDEDGQIYVERTSCAGILTEGGKKDE